MDRNSAIDAIVTYQTLPSQIDYVHPYKVKAEKALKYLESQPDLEGALSEVNEKVGEYYDSPAAYLDSLF